MADLLYAVPRSSAARLRFLTEGASPAVCPHGDGPKATVAALMSDHSVPVRWHTETMATLWSAVAVPARRQAAYCLGAPCRNEYSHEVSWRL